MYTLFSPIYRKNTLQCSVEQVGKTRFLFTNNFALGNPNVNSQFQRSLSFGQLWKLSISKCFIHEKLLENFTFFPSGIMTSIALPFLSAFHRALMVTFANTPVQGALLIVRLDIKKSLSIYPYLSSLMFCQCFSQFPVLLGMYIFLAHLLQLLCWRSARSGRNDGGHGMYAFVDPGLSFSNIGFNQCSRIFPVSRSIRMLSA